MQEFPCIETTIDVQVGNFDVRLWINETVVVQQDESLIKDLVDQVIHVVNEESIEYYCYRHKLVHALAKKIPNINAVQVREEKDGYKVGTMIYTVPFNDYIAA